MKIFRILMLVAMLVSATVVGGCKEDKPEQEVVLSTISFDIERFAVEAAAGEYAIGYTIENEVQGADLNAKTSVDWIESVEVSDDSITISVTQNEAREPRFAEIELNYAGTRFALHVEQYESSRRYDLFAMYNDADIPYRIPSIAVTQDGTLLCVADYRHSRTDIGVTPYGRIDLHINRSYDNGITWEGVTTLINGKGEESEDFMHVGFGDPCIVADRESNRVLMMSCAGNVSYQNGTRDNHQCIARFYSEDGGRTWSEPEDIAESIYSQFDDCAYGPVKSMFVASGKIHQSRHVKVGEYWRLYCAVLVRNKSGVAMNYALYSDDFGGSWKVVGNLLDPPVLNSADEPKIEELPNGNLLISSRWQGGRYYNIFEFTDIENVKGTWYGQIFSGLGNDGVCAEDNSTNGEVLLIPAVRKSDGQRVDVLLQSVPLGPGRSNVGIYYKALSSAADYDRPSVVAANWEGVYQVTELNSAYSTMVLQHDLRIGFLWEDTTYCSGGGGYGGYTIAYECFPLERITDGKYMVAADAIGR